MILNFSTDQYAVNFAVEQTSYDVQYTNADHRNLCKSSA
jgi:hypothetical protein